MEFGWKVPEFPADGSDNAAFIRQTLETLELVEGRFPSAWVTDHMIPWAKWQAVTTPVIECWTTLTFLAARYPELTWGTIVLCQSYRNPALLAKMVANLCTLLPGKVVFGIGAGWKEEEYRAYTWEFPRPAVRIKQLEETVEIAKRLWREDDVTYEGKHYRVEHAYLDPKPDPLPPIMIGGSGEQSTLKVVAKHADWWNGGGTMENYTHKLDVLRGHCEAEGRDFARIKKTWQCECIAVAHRGRGAADGRGEPLLHHAGKRADRHARSGRGADRRVGAHRRLTLPDPLRGLPEDRWHPPLHG